MYMKRLKPIFAIIIFTIGIAATPAIEQEKQEGLTWYTNVDQAIQVSNEENKPIFAFFTGSDWCGWCKKLQRDVFVKKAFQDWAKEEVVLLELDFPRYKKLPEEQAAQNAQLRNLFSVRGYPTIWLFSVSEGEGENRNVSAYGSLGYPSGATKGQEEVAFLQKANSILEGFKKSNTN